MFIKSGVSLRKLQTCMVPALIVCYTYFQSINKKFVITSGDDSKHMVNSLHYVGFAFDVRSRDLTEREMFAFSIFFSDHVDTCYQFIIEKDHVHIEYNESISETVWP